MGFTLKEKKYTWWDFIAIGFACDAFASFGLGVQKMLTAFSAVIQVPVTAKFIDIAIKSASDPSALKETLLWFIILCFCVGWRRISYVVGRLFSTRLEVNGAAEMRKAFTQKRSRLEYWCIEDTKTWDLINRVCKDMDNHATLMLQRTYNLMIYVIRIFGVLFIVFTQVWWVGILASLLCIPLILVSLKSGEKNYETIKETAEYERKHKYFSEVLSGRETAEERALFGYSEYVNKKWYEQYDAFRKIKYKANIILNISVKSGSIVTTILSSFITVVLIFPTAKGKISTGMFIALSTSMYDLVNMLGRELSKAVSQLAGYNAYLKDLTLFAALPEDKDAQALPDKEVQELKSLELKNLSFCYPGSDTYILKDINLKIESGIHYAFVGENGAGKTTIIKLLTGLYSNYEGEILVNGKSLKDYTQPQIKALFCGLYQDFAKYYISILDNIKIGNINDYHKDQLHEIETILKSFDIYEELSNLPKGLHTPLGKIETGGVDLSGGQWQKLAMARTLINPAPLLILDEPTAALDPMSESRLYEQFEKISRGKTTIFISHRLGSTKLADKIFVFKDGRVAEQGSHQELMASKGLYCKMYESQRSWYQ